MLTDDQLKKIKFAFCTHMTMSTYYSATYKSTNTVPVIYMYKITPRHAYGPDELSAEEIASAPKRALVSFACAGKEYGRIRTLNKHVPIKLVEE